MTGKWARDTAIMACLHPGKFSFREIPKRKHAFSIVQSRHVCIDRITGEGSIHIDRICPIRTTTRKDGTCKINWFSGILHHIVEVYIPAIKKIHAYLTT